MSLLQIRKKADNIFLHNDNFVGDFYLSDFYITLDFNRFQIVEVGQAKRKYYQLNEITVFDDTTSGGIETFSTWTALIIRLRDLGYTGIINSVGYNNSLLNTKLDKVTNQTPTQKIYAKNPDGSQTMIDVPSGGSGGGVSSNLKQTITFTGGSQTFTLPNDSKVVVVTVNFAVISDWTVSANTITINLPLVVNDLIDIFGFISTPLSTINSYNNLFTYTGGLQNFTIPINTFVMLVTLNGAPISDFQTSGTVLTIGNSIFLQVNDWINVYGITQ